MVKISTTIPVALTIAGSDSGGGAGVQADLRAFSHFKVHGCSAITALTAQNPHGVSGVYAASATILRQQLERIFEDFPIGVIKTGMLVNARLIHVLLRELRAHATIPLVVDPVMIATSGAHLLDATAVDAMRELITHATLVTPNIPETETFINHAFPLNTERARCRAAQQLQKETSAAILVKGGHAHRHVSADILCDADGVCWRITAPVVAHPLSTHGTGCTLSAAIAANVALGVGMTEAILRAKAYLGVLLATSAAVGQTAVFGFPTTRISSKDVTVTRL
ncbi:MAG: bifunctional hydroxymethylpyrimidine kinase/phosphomethylpyrimidine kinase [Kiritimatiellia bacterium]